jgi:3-dehydroquinate dehydratase-2
MGIKVLVIQGPNLNLLGVREPGIYGNMPMEEINRRLVELGQELGAEVRVFHSNGEGAIIDELQSAMNWADGVVINPGGYSHTSVAIRDAIAAIKIPVIEVHLSNIHAREDFRNQAVTGSKCKALIVGFGWRSYTLGLQGVIELVKESAQT